MLKSLLVPMMMGRVETDALRTGIALMRRHAAQLQVVVGLSAVSPVVAGWEYFPAGMYDTLDEAATAAAEELANQVRDQLAAERVEAAVEVAKTFWLTPSEQTLLHAHAADLLVLGRPARVQDADRRLFANALLTSGRPLLVVPPAAGRATYFDRILIAWKQTREATRAIRDAMPLLAEARSVDVLSVAGLGARAPHVAQAEAEVLRLLAMYGVAATSDVYRRDGRTTGAVLLQAAAERRADLIVAGGYGHSRMAEQVFGGVTRTLYERAAIPVLFSH